MELKLVVLAGAKEGTQIPLKKEKFIIGRAVECTLRAGSEAISRRHCVIARAKDAWVVRDLGSRNGTFLNDQKVESATPLKAGDELRVGPLKFRVEQYVKHGSGVKAAKPAPPAEPAEPQGIDRSKQPPVKNIADAAQRTAAKSDGATSEDDISRWLLGVDAASTGDMLRETQSLSMEETTTIGRPVTTKASGPAATPPESVETDEETDEVSQAAANGAGKEAVDKSSSGGWSLFKTGKNRAKKQPGKLPPRPADPSKDSREAAADILREMTRRR